MLRPRRTLAAAVLLVLAPTACSRKPEPAPAAVTPAPATSAAPFTLHDLAAATALDARLARLTLAAGDLQAAVAAGRSGAPAPEAAPARAAALLPALEQALAEAEHALAAVTHAADRSAAQAALGAAREYAGRLVAAARAERDVAPAELVAAQDRLGSAIAAYRAARSGRRLDAPDPQGAEREFAEARRDLERAETAFGSRTRVAPREEGHEFDPAAARMTGLMAADRARAAAERLAPALSGPASRYAAAEARALEAVIGLAQLPEAERPAAARRHHEAKAEALSALADYFAALASR